MVSRSLSVRKCRRLSLVAFIVLAVIFFALYLRMNKKLESFGNEVQVKITEADVAAEVLRTQSDVITNDAIRKYEDESSRQELSGMISSSKSDSEGTAKGSDVSDLSGIRILSKLK